MMFDRFRGVLGFGPGDLPADLSTFTTRIHPDDLPLWRSAWQAAVDQAAPLGLQMRVLHQSGVWRWYAVQARCWTGPPLVVSARLWGRLDWRGWLRPGRGPKSPPNPPSRAVLSPTLPNPANGHRPMRAINRPIRP